MKVYASQKYVDDAIASISNPSWNDLTDKPFYEEGLTPIAYDGVVGDKTVVTANDTTTLVKVSDKIFSKNDLINVTISTNKGQHMTFPSEQIGDLTCGVIVSEAIFSVSNPTAFTETMTAAGMPVTFTEAGTYIMHDHATDTYVTSITFAGSAIKTLDEKFIPDTIARVSDLQEALGAYITDINALIGGDE